MSKTIALLELDLTLFDGGSAPAASTAAECTASAQAGPQQEGPGISHQEEARSARAQSAQRDGADTPQRIVYGRQPEPEGVTAPEPPPAKDTDTVEAATITPEQRKAEFERLISGDYRDLFHQRMQSAINRRFGEKKALEEKLSATRPVLDLLAQRYGVDDGDPAKLAQAIEEDDVYWSLAAENSGMDVKQFRQFQSLQQENARLAQAQRELQGHEAARLQSEAWMREAGELRQTYPSFDLAAECEIPQFYSMLRAGIPLRHAYEVAHLDDIKTGAAEQAAKQTEKQVVDAIRAKGARPSENGTSGQAGMLVKSDPSKLTRADRAEISKRVARGEAIHF